MTFEEMASAWQLANLAEEREVRFRTTSDGDFEVELWAERLGPFAELVGRGKAETLREAMSDALADERQDEERLDTMRGAL